MPLEKPTKPDAITAVPTPVPLRTDRANFAARGDAMMGWFPTGIAGVNTTLTYFGNAVNFVEQEANEAEASATAAAASNAAAAVNAAAAAASAGATVWVTGTTYAAGNVRYSPTNYQTYRDTAGGLSSTDPASDTTGRWISAMLPSAEAIGLPDMYPTAVLIGNGQIDRRLVQGRTATKYRYNSFGNLEALPAGVSKVDFHPVTKRCEGYKSEPALNYIPINSADFSGWGGSDTGGGFGAAVAAPDGTLTAKTWTVPTSTSQFAYGQKILYGGFDASSQVVFEIWVRRQSGAGSFGLAASDITAVSNSDVVTVDSTWRKVSFTSSTLTNTGNIGVGFNGTAGDVFELWHPTFTLGTTKNPSYYPTVGSLVTTVEDNLTLDLTAHTEIINPRGFAFVCAFDGDAMLRTSGLDLILFSVGVSPSDIIYISHQPFGKMRFIVRAGGVTLASMSIGDIAAGRNVVAASFQAGQCLASLTGNAAVVAATASSLPNFASLHIGGYGFSSGFEAIAPIHLAAIYPRACTAGELRAFVNNF